MSKVNAYLLAHRKEDDFWLAPRIVCTDGFSMSVQVHQGAYCSPRDGIGPDWSEAEIGFPSERPSDAVMAYAEEPGKPTETVYGYVSVRLIDDLVEAHGGFSDASA